MINSRTGFALAFGLGFFDVALFYKQVPGFVHLLDYAHTSDDLYTHSIVRYLMPQVNFDGY